MEEYRRWEDNFKMDLKEIGVDVYNLAQDRDDLSAIVSATMNLQIT